VRALQLTAPNRIDWTDCADPVPAPGEVVVGLVAAALNHRDVWIKAGQYAGIRYPIVPGSDGAGIVQGLGAGVDSSWRGREVIINPAFGWGMEAGAPGADFSILGLPRDGTLAEQVAVPVAQLSPKPTHLSSEEAAALPLAGLTAYRALFARGQLARGEHVLISGIGGGVAGFALQYAVAAGAEVWVTSGDDSKIARARELGARGGFRYDQSDWIERAVREVGGFELILDGAGGAGWPRLLDLLRPAGRMVVYGATRGNPPEIPMRKIFWRQVSVLGTTMGSPDNWDQMIQFVTRHEIHPIISRSYERDEALQAFAAMEQGSQFGKLVIRLENSK